MDVIFPELTDAELKDKLIVPSGKIRLVIDTDAKNEVDDQFAVSWALKSKDRFDVEAVYAAPFSQRCFMKLAGQNAAQNTGEDAMKGITLAADPKDGMEASYQELLKLFGLLGEETEGRVFRGSEEYLSDIGGPVESEAARDLVKRAMASDETLYVATIGAPTNVASALLMEPELVKKIVVVWLGGQPVHFGHGVEFNLMQDVKASQILFDSGVPLVMVPCMSVASMLTLTKAEIEQCLIGRSAISDYLGQIVLDAFGDDRAAMMMPLMLKHLYLAGRDDLDDAYLFGFAPGAGTAWSRIIWDISTIAFLKNPGWVTSKLEPAPVLNDDLTWGKPDGARHMIRMVNFCWRDLIFGDMIACLNK